MTAEQRAKELAQFFGMSEADALAKLNLGFGYHHAEVTADWKRANPQTDDEILEWYRTTDSYVWELSSYHLDENFNYRGQCAGIAESLLVKSVNRVLCLGDGIGDLSIWLRGAGMDAVYHDLAGSRTAQFAEMRTKMYLGEWRAALQNGWMASTANPESVDAVVSLDYLEHVVDVERDVRAIYAVLRPGGWLCSQNAFACGSGPDGSIPQHLARNDRFEKDWDPYLFSLGFTQLTSNWYRKPL